jgi:serine/threonine-protein kinase
MAPAGCPDRETLAALAAGLLSGDALDAVAAHLDACPACLALAQAACPETDPLVAALCRPGPADPYAREAGCDEAVARLRGLADSGVAADTTVVGQGDGPGSGATGGPEAGGGRYRPVRLHARGGLGEVHVALDEELSRQVALKRIRGPGAGDPESRRRFLREAEITARLEHPGVVPVYGLVKDGSGQPCYAMRFIEGETLQEALTRFHAADGPGRDPGERRLAWRTLLGRFVAVCNTVAYAHSKGVLHRDLKPANVMLGAYGETLVVDWGLAKAVGDGPAGAGAAAGADGEEHTRAGQVLGTPAYMSPEQAAGQASVAGPAGDVYGLGATLYAVLTGRPPLEGPTADVLERVKQGKVPPPRARKKDVPRPLEAICRKAMALRPGDRYETALALTADVEHWLADEPVSAYREPLPARLARWGRRHRAWVAGAAAVLLLAVVGLAAGLVVVNRERARTAAQRDKKEEARQQARKALNKMTDETVSRLMAQQPHTRLTEPDRAFLREVLALHEEFARAQEEDSPESRAGIADAQFRVGTIRSKLGETREAEEAFRAAIELRQRLADDFPGQPEHRRALAECHRLLGHLLHETGQPRQAEQEFRAARDLYQRLAADFPGESDHRRDLAASHGGLGAVLAESGRLEGAEEAFRAGVDIADKLADEFPLRADYHNFRAAGYGNLAIFLFNTNRPEEAEKYYRGSRDLFQQLADQFPKHPSFRRDLAQSHIALGGLLGQTGRWEKSVEANRAAIAILRKLAAEFPAQSEYRDHLARGHFNLAEQLRGRAPQQQVEEAYVTARDLYQKLTDDSPDVSDYHNGLAGTLGKMALLKGRGGDCPAARQLLEQALPHHQAALGAEPKNPFYREPYRTYLGTLAPVFLGLGDHKQAADTADELAAFAYTPAEDAFIAACYVSRCVDLAGEDRRLTEAQRQELTRAYAERAMALLHKAVQHGFKDSARIRKDPVFDPIHARDDFRKLLQDLDAARGRPGGPPG